MEITGTPPPVPARPRSRRDRERRWGIAALVAGASGLFDAARAAAQGHQPAGLLASQRWTPPTTTNDCVDPPRLARLVEDLLGRSVMAPVGRADVALAGRFVPDQVRGGWSVYLSLSTADGRVVGTREVRSPAPNCSDLTDSLALVVALMIDLPRDRVVLRVPRPTARAPASRWQLRVGAGGAVGAGWMPAPSLGVVVHAELFASRIGALLVEGAAWFDPRSATEGEGARFAAQLVSAWLCPPPLRASVLEATGCAGGQVGAVHAEGFGFRVDRAQTAVVGGPGVRAGLAIVPAPWLSLRLAAWAVVAAVQNQFVGLQEGRVVTTLFVTAPVTGGAEIEVGLRFPP